jgi:hypothetical protein
MLQVFHLDITYACNDFQVSRKCFKRILQVFHLFRTYIASVSSRCCKSRSDVAHVANALRSGGGLSGPCARTGGVGSTWARETQAWGGGVLAQVGRVDVSAGIQCRHGCANVQALAPLFFIFEVKTNKSIWLAKYNLASLEIQAQVVWLRIYFFLGLASRAARPSHSLAHGKEFKVA